MKSRIEDKLEKKKKEKDLRSMGMKEENKGPIKILKKRKTLIRKKTPIKLTKKDEKIKSPNFRKNNKKPKHKKSTLGNICKNKPINVIKLPKLNNIPIGKKLRKIIFEDINLPIRERTQEIKYGRSERWFNRVNNYNKLLNKLLDNCELHDASESKKYEQTIYKLNEEFRENQARYLLNALRERFNYETLCTMIYNLFMTPCLLNKCFQTNLILVNIDEEKIKHLTFTEYRNKLLLPIWNIMSQSIDNIIGSTDDVFDKCIGSITDKIDNFEKTVGEFKKTIGLVTSMKEIVKNKENNNNNNDMLHTLNNLIKLQTQMIEKNTTDNSSINNANKIIEN
nr:MAG: wsv161-like protein [Metapenaeopsis lamellata majanivirus]